MDFSDVPELAPNAISVNAISVNAISVNAISVNALSLHSLSLNGLLQSPLAQSMMADAPARDVLRYVVSCALPADQKISYTTEDSTTYDFSGSLGLAPEWGKPDGVCNVLCQQWVSACVLSRGNYLGEHVQVSLRGPNPGLNISYPEYLEYTHREATYYGNIFSPTQRFFGCLPPGETQDPRVCGPSIDSCAIKFTGSCDKVCDSSAWYGGYYNCRGPSDREGHLLETKTYVGGVTIFLKP